VVHFIPRPFLPQDPLDGRVSRPQSRSGRFGEEKGLLRLRTIEFRSPDNFLLQPDRYTDRSVRLSDRQEDSLRYVVVVHHETDLLCVGLFTVRNTILL
jgi:hypothetical protein